MTNTWMHFNSLQMYPWIGDDTKILEAEPGDYITIARKEKGKENWFLGAITDERSCTLSVSLDFLDAGASYEATIYRAADKADWETNAEAYTIEKKAVNKKTKLSIGLANGGGCAIRLIKK